ncbi:MAG TPA: GPP34 family phosphoprotein, partial [Herpetosiphonaceae bacterium]
LTLMELLARQLITLRHEEKRLSFGRTRKTDYLQLSPDAQTQVAGSPAFQAALGVVAQARAKEADATIPLVVQQARKSFGTDLGKFQSEQIIPALIRRGLIEQYTKKRLGLFNTTRYRPTAAGEALRQEITGHLNQARTLPTLVDHDPATAAALIATLGATVLLVDELKPHYGRISQALNVSQGGDSVFAGPFDHDDSDFDGFDFDFSAFDTLDSTLDSFDSSFDSADFGGDSGDGGDGGGGGD